MKLVDLNIIYENSMPQLRSRHSFFPSLCKCKDGTLVAVYVVGEAFESIDGRSCISFSNDEGKTWSEPLPMFDKSMYNPEITDFAKVTALADGKLLAFGYAYIRDNPELPIGNPENGGLLEDIVFYSVSDDNGKTWSKIKEVECTAGNHIEASGPICVLNDGSWITPTTVCYDWNGNLAEPHCGRALRSFDEGKTWNDDSICMEFNGNAVTCYEQRMCQLESGAIICIGWNENVKTGERLNNHYTVSYDNGKTWSEPINTGIKGQASSVCAIGGERLLALHAVRRDTDCPGIYGCIVDFSQKQWNIIDQKLLWAPSTPVKKDSKMAEIFSFLKFGQPSAIMLDDKNAMMTFWSAEEGQYRTFAAKIELEN